MFNVQGGEAYSCTLNNCTRPGNPSYGWSGRVSGTNPSASSGGGLMSNQATKPGKEAIDLNMQSDIGDAAERIPAKMRRSRFQGAYGLAVSSLALLALSSSLCPGYGGNLVTLDSEHLGGGIFEYRLTCNPQPYLERSGLSNF